MKKETTHQRRVLTETAMGMTATSMTLTATGMMVVVRIMTLMGMVVMAHIPHLVLEDTN